MDKRIFVKLPSAKGGYTTTIGIYDYLSLQSTLHHLIF